MNVDSPDKIYDEISDFASLTSQMDTYLEEFNQMSKTPMSLVMFKFAIEHISRVSRVLKQDNGHLLLVGTFTLFYVFKHRRFPMFSSHVTLGHQGMILTARTLYPL